MEYKKTISIREFNDVRKNTGLTLSINLADSTGFLSLGRLQSIQDQRQMALANERVEGAKTRWEGNAVWSIIDGCKFGEWKPLSKTGLYILINLSASITPSATLFALAEAIIKSVVK